MRILMVMPSLNFYGGAAVVFVKLANFFQINGHSVTILTNSICSEVSDRLDVQRIISKPNNKSKGNIIVHIFFILRLSYKLRRSFDIINIHNFPSSLCLLFFKKPSVWMCNEPPSVELRYEKRVGLKKIIANFLIRLDRSLVSKKVNTIIVADVFNQKRIKAEYGLQSEIIHYGIDSNFFKYENKTKKNFIILQVGVLTPEKNQFETIKAFKDISRKILNARLIIVGKPEKYYQDFLEKKIKEWGIQDRVDFFQNQKPEIIRELYYKCSVLMHPVNSQGGWLSAFEAISCGIPIITSEHFTAKDILSKNSLGVITKDYTDAIMEVFSNPIHSNELERRSKWVNDNLSWHIFCQSFMQRLEVAFGSKSELK